MAVCLWEGKVEFREKVKSNWNSKASTPRRLHYDNPKDAVLWRAQHHGIQAG
jgi:hypothetical protein